MRNLLGLKSWNRPPGVHGQAAACLPVGAASCPFPDPPPRRLARAFSWWTAAGRRPGPASGPRHLKAKHVRARSRGLAGRAVEAGRPRPALPVTRRPGGAGRLRAGAAPTLPPAFTLYPFGKQLLRVAREGQGQRILAGFLARWWLPGRSVASRRAATSSGRFRLAASGVGEAGVSSLSSGRAGRGRTAVGGGAQLQGRDRRVVGAACRRRPASPADDEGAQTTKGSGAGGEAWAPAALMADGVGGASWAGPGECGSL